jgi:UDP-N-acetylmuramoyl-tripeptide--D-alanyl-D-alanine ligase
MYYVVFVNMLIQPYENHNNKKFYKMAEKKLASMPDLKIIGVTGSYGKTSVKYILTSILKQKYNTFMTPGNFNTLLGVQRSINEHLKSTDEIFVCEMGAKEVGKIKEICDLVKPKMGILTAVGPQHLETFGSLENIKKAKMELINSVPEDGLRVVNFENENAADAAKDTKCLKYGLNKNFDAYAYNIKMTDTGSSFDIHTKDLEIHDIKTKLIGKLNIINIVGAVAVAANLGLSEDEIKAGIRFLQPVPHRL